MVIVPILTRSIREIFRRPLKIRKRRWRRGRVACSGGRRFLPPAGQKVRLTVEGPIRGRDIVRWGRSVTWCLSSGRLTSGRVTLRWFTVLLIVSDCLNLLRVTPIVGTQINKILLSFHCSFSS